MIRILTKLLSLPTLALRFYFASRKQKAFMKKYLEPLLLHAMIENDGSLAASDFEKIRKYYGWAVPALLGESFSALRGEPFTKEERHGLTYLGALTGLFDDFFDEKRLDLEHIKGLITNPDITEPNNSHEKLFLSLYLEALKYLDMAHVQEKFLEVLHAQVASLEQLDQGITVARLEEITANKGGVSLLFYGCAFKRRLTAEEAKMIYMMGAVGQLENDIFDVYKDIKQNINTLATQANDMDNLRSIYIDWINRVFTCATDINKGGRRLNFFLDLFFAIACRGIVCLDFLQHTTAKCDGAFVLKEMSRKDLVCDMESPTNITGLIVYYVKGSQNLANIS